jgi:hypothetical protein
MDGPRAWMEKTMSKTDTDNTEVRDQLTVDKIGQVIRELTADELALVSGGITIKQKIAE